MVETILATIDFLDEMLDRLIAEIDERLGPVEATQARLDTIPGVNRTVPTCIVAETGGDRSRFPTAGHLCGRAAPCPRHNESAAKREAHWALA